MSRRGNGLSADSYTPLADLAPQLADAMLTALREAGVAAYAIPAPGEVGGYLDVRLPDEPTDRLYVDAKAQQLAESVLHAQLPELKDGYEGGAKETGAATGAATDDREEAAIWEEIVASFDKPTEKDPSWPEEENVEDPHEVAPERPSTARVVKPAVDDEEDHYVPPPPPPLPQPDPVAKAAWLALFGGPLYLLVAAMLGWGVPGWAAFTAVAAFVGGFVTLVLRMGDEPPRDSDDGAVV